MMKQTGTIVDKIGSNDERNSQIQKLERKLLLLQKENKNVKELHEKTKEEFLSERRKVEKLGNDLQASENALATQNNNTVALEGKVTSVEEQMKRLQDENMKLKDYVPKMESEVIDLEKRLCEEEFISKRLAVEVRSLEAQLSYADRQLRYQVDTQVALRTNGANPWNKSSGNARKMSAFPDEYVDRSGDSFSSKRDRVNHDSKNLVKAYEVSSCASKSSSSADSIVSKRSGVYTRNENRELSLVEEESSTFIEESSSIMDDSTVSEVSMMSGSKNGGSLEQTNNATVLCSSISDERLMTQQEGVLKRLRRRSAVYAKRTSRSSEISDRRRSTIGTESFVVGQFSSTIADEPGEDDHHYEWDRILELRERNAICARHLRSSYPVETQVHPKEKVGEEDLKSGTTTNSCKHLRAYIGDGRVSKTRCLPRSENMFTGKIPPGNSRVSNDQNESLMKSFPDKENIDKNSKRRESIAFKVDITPAKKSRRSLIPDNSAQSNGQNEGSVKSSLGRENVKRPESIAFKVDITPAKKARMSLRPRMLRSLVTEKALENKDKMKATKHSAKEPRLLRKPTSVKQTKKLLRNKRTSLAI